MITTFLVLVLVGVLILYVFTKDLRPLNYPPGPPWWPFIGNGLMLRKLSKQLKGQHLALSKLGKDYKTPILGLKLGGDLVVVTLTLEANRAILTRNVFTGRPVSFFMKLRCFGKIQGITSTDGIHWKEQRSFTVRHLKQFGFGKEVMESLIADEVREVIRFLGKEEKVESIGDATAPSVLNVLWALATGKLLEKHDPRLKRLLKLLSCRSRAFDMAGGILNQMPWLRFVAPKKTGYSLLQELNLELKSFFMETINEQKKTYDPNKTRNLIDAFLHEQKAKSQCYSNFSDKHLSVHHYRETWRVDLLEALMKEYFKRLFFVGEKESGPSGQPCPLQSIRGNQAGFRKTFTSLNHPYRVFWEQPVHVSIKVWISQYGGAAALLEAPHLWPCHDTRPRSYHQSPLGDISFRPLVSGNEELVVLLLDLFLGGAQTTSQTLDFAFLLMIKYPEVQEKVYRNIVENVGKERFPTTEDKPKLIYTEAVLLEVLRMFCVVPIIGPRRSLDDTILNGYFIPKNTTILLNLYTVHHDESLFPNPHEFRPERFISADGQSLVNNENILTFGLGKRRCLGEVLAKSCLFLIFTGIIQKFEISKTSDKEPPLDPLIGLTLAPKPYSARFRLR